MDLINSNSKALLASFILSHDYFLIFYLKIGHKVAEIMHLQIIRPVPVKLNSKSSEVTVKRAIPRIKSYQIIQFVFISCIISDLICMISNKPHVTAPTQLTVLGLPSIYLMQDSTAQPRGIVVLRYEFTCLGVFSAYPFFTPNN